MYIACMTYMYWNGSAKVADMKPSHFRTDWFSKDTPEFTMLIHAGHLQKVTMTISLIPRLSSVVGEKKRAWYTLFAHARFPQDFWEFGKFHKICFITLTSARHAYFSSRNDTCHWAHSVWTMTKEHQRRWALLLQKLSMGSSISAKHCGTWLM